MKSIRPAKSPKMPRMNKMEPGQAGFPRSVSSTTTHTLPGFKNAPSAAMDSQINGLPSAPIKPIAAPTIKAVGGISGVPTVGPKPKTFGAV